MKSLRVFVCILLATVSILGAFSTPGRALAQGTSCDGLPEVQRNACLGLSAATGQMPSGGTYDYFYNQASSIFNTGIQGLRNVLASQNANNSAPNKAQNIESTNAYIDIAIGMQKTYDSSFNKSKSAGTTPVKAQQEALRASMDTYATGLSNMGSKADYSSDARAVMNAMLANPGGIGGLQAQANQISSGSIAAGSDKANVLSNATAIGKVAQGRADNAKKVGACSIGVFSEMNLPACIDEGVSWLIKNTLLEIAGWFVWLTANMFNYSIQLGILRFSEWAPDTLYPIWIIVRQIISLIVVFAGLYLGFLYILGDPQGKFERYIPWVVMFGLFVNFSYPLARTAIDVSNIVSLNIYASAIGNDALNAGAQSSNTAGALIMNKLGLRGLVMSAVDQATVTKEAGLLGSIDSVPGSLLAVIFVFYAAYIFFMVTAIMAMRTAVLVFITIASPLLLVDSVLPLLGERAKWLRKIFIEQLAVGPVFMILLALTLKFLDVFNVGITSTASSASGSTATITTFFNLLIMIIMLHIMMKVTKEVAGQFGNFATNMIGQVGGFGLGVATGGAGFLARRGVGGLAVKAMDRGWVSKDPGSVTGRIANTLANSTFDLRNSSVIAGGLQKAGISSKGVMGIGAMGQGAGAKMGFVEASEAKTKKILERADRIKTKYERDIYKKDANGNVIFENGAPVIEEGKRRGDIDKDAEEAKNQYLNRNGTRLLTKEESQRIQNTMADKDAAVAIEEYKKIKTKAGKDSYSQGLKNQLEELKKSDPKLQNAKSLSIAQTLTTIAKEEKAFDQEVEDIFYKVSQQTNPEEKQKFLSRQSKDIQEDIRARTNNLQSSSLSPRTQATTPAPVAPTATTPTISTSPLQGTALREERIAKVAKGREEELQNTKKAVDEINARYDKKLDDISMAPSISSGEHIAKLEETRSNELQAVHEEVGRLEKKQEHSKVSAEVFAQNLNTMSFAERAAARRAEALAKASALAQQDMAGSTRTTPSIAPAVPVAPSTVTARPSTPVSPKTPPPPAPAAAPVPIKPTPSTPPVGANAEIA